MVDRPIIMDTLSVQRLLREIRQPGTGKTQTRRLTSSPLAKCQPGDRLWVKETFFEIDEFRSAPLFAGIAEDALFKADQAFIGCHHWRPSIHMPRRLSRIWLAVEAVRIEPLHDISDDDAIAEGCGDDAQFAYLAACKAFERHHGLTHGETATRVSGVDPYSARWSFACRWNGLHGPAAWAMNPAIVAITFRPSLGNIDGERG